MTLSDLLTHIEWLAAGIATTAVVAFGALYWVWSFANAALKEAIASMRTEYQSADETIRSDLVGVRNQVSAFQTDMYKKEDAAALETKFFSRIDRVEDKIDDRMDRFDAKIDQLLRHQQ